MSTHPNIILIIMDTARRDNFSCYGYNRLAISSSPWTLPSHASFLTGKTVGQHKITQKAIYDTRNGQLLNFDLIQGLEGYLPAYLKTKGYQTVGISNNAWISKSFGFQAGFDIFIDPFSYKMGFIDSLKKFIKNRISKDISNFLFTKEFMMHSNFRPTKSDNGACKTHHDLENIFSRGIFTKDKPFFLFLNFLEPHLPYLPPAPYDEMFMETASKADRYKVNQNIAKFISGDAKMSSHDFEILKALYDGELCYLDKKIDDILKLFRDSDLMDNSVFIVTSDHGENIGEHGLMGHQLCVYDTLLAVPLIIYGPKYISGRFRQKRCVMLKDIYYTISALASGLPNDRSILNDRYHQLLIAEYEQPVMTLGSIKRRYPHIDLSRFNTELRALYDGSYKLIQSRIGETELYNLDDDPRESHNIALNNDTITKRMKKILEDYHHGIASPEEGMGSFEHKKSSGQGGSDKRLVEDKLRSLGYLG